MDPDSSCHRNGKEADSWKSQKTQEQGQLTSAEFRKMEEKITDMDVQEAVKKLTQAVNQYQKRMSSEDRSLSSAGHHRFYNWNTTHFYPDVHKLDIGILFRHNDKFNRLEYHERNSSDDDEPGYVSTSSSEDNRQKAQKDFAQKKMLLTQPPRSHIDNIGATRNGLGVKIDIGLDSCSDSDEDGHDKLHKSPVHVRRIRRQDGRPLSAEINYDAASKKLYIHTLSKKLDTNKTNGKESEVVRQRPGKISRRLSAPGSGGSYPVKRFERKTEKGISEITQKQSNSLQNVSAKLNAVGMNAKARERRDFIKECGKLQGLDLYNEIQEKPRTGQKFSYHGDGRQGGSHLSWSHEDIDYTEPSHPVKGQLGSSQSKSLFTTDQTFQQEPRSSGTSQTNSNRKLVDGYQQSQAQNDIGVLQSRKGFGRRPGTGSSFENIYDSVSLDVKSQNMADKVELYERKREKFQENQSTGNRKTHVDSPEVKFPNIRQSSFYDESKSTKQTVENANSKKQNFSCDHRKVSPMTRHTSQPQSGCQNSATPDQSNSRKLHIDAKTLMEEEKQKFEDYKIEYRRQYSGQESEPSGDEKDVTSSQSADESHVQPQMQIPPDDYVYILRKIHHTRQDALVHNEPRKTTSSALQVDLSHQPKSESIPLTRSEPGLSLSGSQRRPPQKPMKTEQAEDLASKSKPIQLPSEIYLDRYEYNRNMLLPKDDRTSEQVNGPEPKTSAFQRIIRSTDSHHTDPASFDGNHPIHSRRPDLIPSPMTSAAALSYPIDTKQSKVKEVQDREETVQSSCRVDIGGGPDQTLRGQGGLLHKPPKPRKDEFSAGALPKQWMYNTTYEPSTPPTHAPEGQTIFTKTSPVCSKDGQFPTNFESRGSAHVYQLPPLPPPLPTPPPPPPSSPSTLMNVFRTLPEQYRLSIQEPSSSVTDSIITKNGILPLYHKESDEGKVKIPKISSSKEKKRDPAFQTYLTDAVLNEADDRRNYGSGQRYDKATVFSITGFHKPSNDSAFVQGQVSPHSPETFCDSFSKHPGDLDINLDPSFAMFNSDCLKQTQWTDAEKRRPFVWKDTDKRRPIVDWPDLDNISLEPDFKLADYQRPFGTTFDPRDHPSYDQNSLDVAGRQEIHDEYNVKQQKIASYEKSDNYLSQTRFLGSSPARRSSPSQKDLSSPISCQVRSTEFSQLKGHLLEGGSPQVFYAVKIPSGQANTATDRDGRSPAIESPPYPPRPSSRVPQYNQDPLLETESQESVNCYIGDIRNVCGVDFGGEVQPHSLASSKPSNKQSGEFGKPVWPPVPQEDDRRTKGVRSASQPDAWHPVGGSGNVQRKPVPENKLQQVSSDEKTKEKRNTFQNQSKATAEYEKHVNRSQESYKAKKMMGLEPQPDELLIPQSLNITASSNLKRSSSREEVANVVLPKQKSALELHLSSLFAKPSASAGTTPSDDFQKSLKREPFNIEVDIQPPRTADSPQVFGMSVRLSASQEQLAQTGGGGAVGGSGADDEMPHISITAIKAKLFGESEEEAAKKQITGRQLPIHVDHQQSRQPALKSSTATKDPPMKKLDNTNAPLAKSKNQTEDDRLYDYVSYKDGLKKKTSKIYDQLTDFERTYEGLNFDDDAENDCATMQRYLPQDVGRQIRPDPSDVKRLSITNLKLLTESQERLVPNSSLEYTKEWLRSGKGPDFGSANSKHRHEVTAENVHNFRNPTVKLNSGIHPGDNPECLTNFPRKVRDDLAYRKYGQGSMICTKSDPDLPVQTVLVGTSSAAVKTTGNFLTDASERHANETMTGLDNLSKAVLPQQSQTPKELKKVQIEAQINYRSPSCSNHTADQPVTSKPCSMSSDHSVRSAEPRGTRVNLRQLNRSSSFESSCREAKPETRPSPASGVAKLVELFELSQSAPDLTEGDLFSESYTETGDVKVTPKPKKQKTPKDVKLRSENRSRIRLLKVNADSGYVESESDSHSSSGPELQPLTYDLIQNANEGQMDYNNQPLSDTESQEELKRYLVQKLNFAGGVQSTRSCEEVAKKSETPEERMRRLQKLREEWFQKNPETVGVESGFDARFNKKFAANSMLSRNILMMPSGPVATTASVEQRQSSVSNRSYLPSGNPPVSYDSSLVRPGKSLDSLDSVIKSKESFPAPWQPQKVGDHASSTTTERISTRTEQTIGLNSVRGPEIQKTTINLSLSTPAAVPKVEQRDALALSRVSFPSVPLTNRDHLVTFTTTGSHHQLDCLGPSAEIPTTVASTEFQAEDFKVTEKQLPSGFSREREDETFQQSSNKDRTITELKTEKMKFEPWQFEASKRIERTVDQPLKKSFAYESQEFQHKEQMFADVDVKVTKQHTQTRAERVFKIEKKLPESPLARTARPKDRLPSDFPSALRPSLIDRLEFSDGEMTDATDVTLDALVGCNQARPSSPETFDFSDMEMSASTFSSSKISENRSRAFYTRTAEVVQKSSEGSRKLQPTEAKDPSDSMASAKQEPVPTREELLAKAQSEMKLYRKDRDRKVEMEQPERKRSIKELVDSFEVMTMPFMRTRQRSSEIRSEDVDGAMAEKGNVARKD